MLILRFVFFFLRNNLSAFKHKDFVSQATLELQAGECLILACDSPFLC